MNWRNHITLWLPIRSGFLVSGLQQDISGNGNHATPTSVTYADENATQKNVGSFNGTTSQLAFNVVTQTTVCWWQDGVFKAKVGASTYWSDLGYTTSFTTHHTTTAIAPASALRINDFICFNVELTAEQLADVRESTRLPIISEPEQEPKSFPADVTNANLKLNVLTKGVEGTAKDRSNFGNDFTIGTLGVTPKSVGALFKGVANSNITYAPTLIKDSIGSIVATFAAESLAADGKVFGKVAGLTNRFYLNHTNAGIDIARSNPSASIVLTSEVITKKYYRIGFVWNNGVIKGYNNGVYIGSSNYTVLETENNPNDIGGRTGGVGPYNGHILDFEYYEAENDAAWFAADWRKRVADDTLLFRPWGDRDTSRFNRSMTFTGTSFSLRGGYKFASGGITWSSFTITSYAFWWNDGNTWTHYATDGTTVWANAVSGGTLPFSVGATGFSGQTGTMAYLKCWSEVKSLSFVVALYQKERLAF